MYFLSTNISQTDINNIVKAVNGGWKSYLITLLPSIVSLILVIFNWHSFKKNFELQRKKILADNRISWLDAVENDIASYIGIVHEIANIYIVPSDYISNRKFSRELNSQLYSKESIIRLKIFNDNEHKDFLELLKDLEDLSNEQLNNFKKMYCNEKGESVNISVFAGTREKINKKVEEFVENSRSIFNKKWSESKKDFGDNQKSLINVIFAKIKSNLN